MSAPIGVSPPDEVFYIQSMLFSAESAMASIEAVAEVMEAIRGMTHAQVRETVDYRTLLNELQNIVLQAGALSRYFWPSRSLPQHVARAELLRAKLGVKDDSPLRSRELRNAMEHFDERLDAYLGHGIVGHILPEYVGPRLKGDGVPSHIFRGFFVDEGVFSLLGEEFGLQPIVDELVRIYSNLEYSSENGGRLREAPPASDSANES